MLIYGYDSNGVYMGSQEIADGVEIPTNATKIKPPNLKEYQMLVFENGDWRIKNDYRSVVACQVDENNVYVDKYEFIIGEVPSERTVLTVGPTETEKLFYQIKWDGTAWVEGLTQEEIDIILGDIPQTPVEAAQTIAELNARIDSLQLSIENSNATTSEFVRFTMSQMEALQSTMEEIMAAITPQ